MIRHGLSAYKKLYCKYGVVMKNKNNCILLRQIGKFVNAFDEDALIISYLFNYKVINGKIGFPIDTLPKIINILEEYHINYETKGTNNDIVMNFRNRNKYSNILEKAILKKKMSDRIYSISDKLHDLSTEQLDRIISFIESVINEK